jgi:ABC-2 type transport system ATP-binding protein
MMNNLSIHLDDLRVSRGGRRILDGISFSIGRGSLVGLLGPSGSGKTTLMRAIVGVQAIDSGTVEVLGRPAGSPELRSKVGYVTQAPSVYPDLTVIENVRYFAAVLGAPAADVQRVLWTVGLQNHAAALTGELSGGERARVSLATALLGKPELLVLDEPTVGLDPVLRRDLWQVFGELADSGTTLLVSSHVMDEAQRCERLLILRDGRLFDDESPTALLSRTGAVDLEAAFLHLVEKTVVRP